jgi:lipopolysaccharide biosynthesis glycosyltransferase
MSDLKIFIGWDSRFPEPALVLEYSLKKHSSIPLDINFLKYEELDFNREPDPLASTEFTYTRFLVPHLCGFKGKAIFMDNDMLCFNDIKELDDLSMEGLTLRVVKHDHKPLTTTKMYGTPQTSYPRKNWSSLMLMDCSKLTIWTKRVVETASGAYLHRFEDILDENIGDIDSVWNSLDMMDDKTKIIHYTDGGPWFENYVDHPHADIWFFYRDKLKNEIRRS